MSLSKNFIDRVEINAKSGNGGNGIVHFRHEKYVLKGGPDGGNGGKGGDIIFRTNGRLSTLSNLRYRHHFTAGNGENGGENNCTGKDADDIIIEVPLGTVIYDKKTGEKIVDLSENVENIVLLKGGRGGLGNTSFKTSTNQAPMYAQNGESGIEKEFILELSILADVGFVGLPNVGKSTLLSILTNAKPEIGNYNFTTLHPQLGILKYKNGQECIIADLPGLIEGASSGKGLGFRFLQHVKRVRTIVYIVDINSDIIKSINVLRNELFSYDKSLLERKSIICISKCDSLNSESLAKLTNINPGYIYISSFSQYGIKLLVDKIFENLR